MKPLYSILIPLLVFSTLFQVGYAKDPEKTPFASSNPTNLVKALRFKNITGFKYEYPYEQPKGKPWELKEQFDKRVPEHVRKLDGRHVSIQGSCFPWKPRRIVSVHFF